MSSSERPFPTTCRWRRSLIASPASIPTATFHTVCPCVLSSSITFSVLCLPVPFVRNSSKSLSSMWKRAPTFCVKCLTIWQGWSDDCSTWQGWLVLAWCILAPCDKVDVILSLSDNDAMYQLTRLKWFPHKQGRVFLSYTLNQTACLWGHWCTTASEKAPSSGSSPIPTRKPKSQPTHPLNVILIALKSIVQFNMLNPKETARL